jgi:cation/acetate symporter
VGLGLGAVGVAILVGPSANVAFLVGLAFAVAASANLPVIVLSLLWRRFNTAGAVSGMAVGLVSSIALIAVSPSFLGASALFPIENPGIVSIPAGFLGAVLGTLASRDRASEEKYTELLVRANTGLGAEKAVSH